MCSDKNCCRSEPAALGVKSSPFSRHDECWCQPSLVTTQENGDESRPEATAAAATAVVDGMRPPVSPPAGLETSPTGRARGTFPPAVEPPAVADPPARHDLGGGGLASRKVPDRARVLRGLLRGPQTSRQDGAGIPEGALSCPRAATQGVGRGGAPSDPGSLRRAVADRRLRADGLRWVPHRVS